MLGPQGVVPVELCAAGSSDVVEGVLKVVDGLAIMAESETD